MKRLFTFLLFLFFITKSFAQFDTEHWFAPMIDRTGGVEAEQYLYLSTNKSTPFTVEIYNNNSLYKSVKISKGNPAKIYIDRSLMITENQRDLFTPNKMGLHLIGEYKFFAHFRFAVKNHAEIITSKGKAALGKTFYAGMAENSVGRDYINSMVGITATEDNTVINISGYKPGVIFSNSTTAATANSLTTTLNKGESYIFDVISTKDRDNLNGLIGTKIESNNPICITNGNFDAISPNKSNIDIVMDQSIPVERLGREYVIMNGNGSKNSPSSNYTGMEKTLIIATEDNTDVFLNNNTAPINITKAGDYLIVESTNYISQSTDVFSLYVNSSKNIYVYQHLAGNNTGTEFASAGMNLIPALACLLPNKIEEFGLINEIGDSVYDTKLNIIAEKDAKVYVNGTLLNGALGPFPILGNTKWETYYFPNVRGNVTVSADKAITAGIAAGNGAVGYGGYFAGFNSNPIISKGGDCNKNNITLEVDDTYDSYQWYYNGNPYTGTGNNTYIINPKESGEYYVKIVKAGCGSLDSPVFNYQTCPYKSVNNVDISSCKPTYTTPVPTFSNSSQSVDISSLKITKNPTNGSVSINPSTGEITYTLTNFSATTDTFTYSFSGTDPKFPDTEFVTVNININYLKVFTGETFACIKPDNTGDFDLTKATISNDSNITSIEYYENYNSATKTFSNLISNSTSYNSTPKTVFAKVTNSFGCVEVANIELKFYPIPNINTISYNSTLCDIDLDGLYEVDFQKEVAPFVVNGYQNFDIYYSLSNDFSIANRLPNNWSYTTPTRVYVLVASKSGCTDATGYIDFKIGTKITVNNISASACDNERDGKTNIKISDYLPFATAGTQYYYYDSFQKAQEALAGTTTTDSHEITKNTTFYIRAENPGFCPNIFELQIIFNQPNVSTTLKDKVICKNTTTVMDAGTGFTQYKWSNGTTGQTATYGLGTHFVELTSPNGCIYKQVFTITEAIDPVIDSVIELGNSITVNVSGGTPPYEYSLNKNNWQTSNYFDNLQRGLQKVYVRDANICTPLEYEFSIINLINAITPNGDGINDVLDYSDLRVKKEVKISIFDRYGKKIYSNDNQTNYIWNGTNSGRIIPSGTYWYILEWTEPDTETKVNYKGWIIIKNRN